MKTSVLDAQGKIAGEVDLADKLFDVPWSPDLVHQVAVIQEGNRRQVLAKVKDRGEVRGGGKKPWRQKGTGRARHGSTRSPIWAGGGVTHGPTADKNFKRKLNLKMRRKALFSLLSEKLRGKEVVLLDSLKLETGKTKELAAALKAFPLKGKSTLLVLPALDRNIALAAANIPYVNAVQARDLNVLDVAAATYIVFPKESLAVLAKTFGK
ncbi:MAG: 50S ribosomal protein L4 [bacterium]|nr:50S ribosomal protein L4 [bacterium]